jgi:hypothetical protein
VADETSEQIKLNNAKQAYLDLLDKINELKANGERISAQEIKNLRKLKEDYDDASKAVDKQREALKKLKDAQEELNDSAKGVADSLLGTIGYTIELEKTATGSALSILSNAEAMGSFAAQLLKAIDPLTIAQNMIANITDESRKLIMAQDQALVSFAQATSAQKLYGDQLIALEENMSQHGVTMDIANESMTSMVQNIKNLNKMSKHQQNTIGETTALLNKFGVSADTTTGNIQFMTATLGIGAAESAKYQRELFTLAREVGMPPAEMAEQFKSAGPKLAAFGKQAGKTFKKLSIAARNANMEVEQLLTITEQFDTFEGAAESVGKLNALLGGPFLNSMEMVMETDPTERMKKLSDGLRSAGKSFDQMSYYERKSIASAAGLADVNELALVMAGNFEGMSAQANLSSSEIEKLAATSKDYNSIMDELAQTYREFAISMAPVIDSLKSVLQWLQELSPETKKFLFWSILLGAGISKLIKFFGPLTKVTSLFGGSLANTVAPAIDDLGNAVESGSKSIASGISNIAKSAAKGAKGLAVLSGVLLAAGASLAMAAYGISFLVAEFAKMDVGKITATTGALIAMGLAGALIMSIFMGFVAGPQAAIATGAVALVLALGAAALMAGLGMALLVGSLTGFLDSVTGEKIATATAGLWTLIGTLSMAALGSYTMIILAGALTLVGLALNSLDGNKINSMAALFEKMNAVTAVTADNILKIGKGMGLIGAGSMLTAGAMLLSPLTALALVPGTVMVGAGKAIIDDAKGGSSTAVSQSPAPQKVVVEIKVDPLFERYFKADVLDIAGKPLNTNNGGLGASPSAY